MQKSQGNKNITGIISVWNKKVGPGNPVFIVAEIANTHEGNFKTALKMVDKIKKIGVDVIKFQLHIHSEEMVPDHPKYHTQHKRSLNIPQIKKLKSYVEKQGLHFLCTPFSRKAVDALCDMGVDVIKIGSGETSDLLFIEHVAKKRKPVILSTGMCTLREIDAAINIFKKYRTPFMLLHCVSIYPPRYEDLSLKNIERYRRKYQVPIGLSDHTPEVYSSFAAVALGANLIEKHYTLDRSQMGTSDHKVSLEPHEFKILVDGIRKIEKSLSASKKILAEEKEVISWARHSVVANEFIKKGEKISIKKLTTKRPLWDGIPANNLPSLIGVRTLKEVKKNQILKWDDVQLKKI